MYDSVTDFDCSYALEILMRNLKNELAMHVDLTIVKGPPKQGHRNFAIYSSLSSDADIN